MKEFPGNLVISIIQARKANKEFQDELNKYIKDLKKNKLIPKETYMEFLSGLAMNADVNILLDNLQISGMSIADLLESLKAHGFPKDFLTGVAETIEQKSHGLYTSGSLKSWIEDSLV